MSKSTSEVEHTSIKLRAYPTASQRLHISQSVGSCRFVYNWALGLKKDQYELWVGNGKPKIFNWLNYNQLAAKLTELKTQHAWLNDVPAQSLQQVLRHLDVAFSRWFKGQAKHPKFKHRSQAGQLHNTNQDIREHHISVMGKWLHLTLPKKQGTLKCRLHRFLPTGRLLKTVISKTSSGQYYVTFMYEVPVGSLLRQSPHKMVPSCGIDLGIIKPLTVGWTVEGEIKHKFKVLGVDVKQRLTTLECRRKRYQKAFARKLESQKRRQRACKPDSDGVVIRVSTKNLEKARVKVAKAYAKEMAVRNNFAQVVSKQLASRFETIKFEDLKLINMTRQVKPSEDGSNRKGVAAKSGLNREMLRLGLGNVVALTQYKARLYGSTVQFVDPKFTSQRCSCCGLISKENRLTQSRFKCVSCGFTLNADFNASLNIASRKPLTVANSK